MPADKSFHYLSAENFIILAHAPAHINYGNYIQVGTRVTLCLIHEIKIL